MAPSADLPDPSAPRQQASRFVTGRLLAGRYEILERIGEGATAEVFRARDHRLDRIVAVKVLRPQYGQDPDARARFAVEARSAAALAVPNIVPVHDFGAADDGSLFIVMRFIDGPSLRRVLAERGALPAAEVVDIGRQVAGALAAAHGHGLIHRDVKPGNILLDAEGTAHLTDFGIVKTLAGGGDLTRTGMVFGTAAYLSPEQAMGVAVGERTDLYSLGVVLYEALSGRPPFAGDDPVAISYQHVHESPLPLSVVSPGTDPELAAVVGDCLQKMPERRPDSAAAVAERLASIGHRLGATAPAVPLGAAASARGDAAGAAAVDGGEREPHEQTVLLPRVAPIAAAAASGLRQVAPAWSPGIDSTTRISPPVPARPLELGTTPAGRGTRVARRRRGGGAAYGAATLLLALALLAIAALALPILLTDRDGGAIGDAPATRPTRTPQATLAAVVEPTLTPAALPSFTQLPTVTLPPAAVTTPEPTLEPTAQPTLEPTPERTRRPRPQPTAEPPPPPPPPATPAPQAENVTARIPDRAFTGDYDGPGSGRYHGRSASWVYGQGTPYHTMTASFRLTHEGDVAPRASLEIVGLDGENARKNLIAIVLNGVTIYQGPNPLPNDECCGPSGPGNWGSAVFEVPGDLLRRQNTLSISNLEPTDCTFCPTYVMLDYAELAYRVRP